MQTVESPHLVAIQPYTVPHVDARRFSRCLQLQISDINGHMRFWGIIHCTLYPSSVSVASVSISRKEVEYLQRWLSQHFDLSLCDMLSCSSFPWRCMLVQFRVQLLLIFYSPGSYRSTVIFLTVVNFYRIIHCYFLSFDDLCFELLSVYVVAIIVISSGLIQGPSCSE